MDFKGITDKEVIHIANKEHRTILTFDADYGELIFKHNLKPEGGVIFLRLVEFSPSFSGKIVHQLVSSPEFQSVRTLTVVDEDAVRQRKY